MTTRTSRRPALGTLLGGTALIVAVVGSGGVAEAKKLINGGLIKPNTVTGKQIKDGTVTAADLAKGVLPTAGAAVAGPQGAQGPQGQPGADGVSGYEMKSAASASVASGVTTTVNAQCPAGKKILGATAYWIQTEEAVQVYPSGGSSTTSWYASGKNTAAGSDRIELRIICATVTS
ncbi:MAG: hypothetical protein QM572_04140 [Nocardioides sp.]|uniref:hypothetical protein n=1 Tax=Nocardioides sp. TaxID=35761 RepID=UPI0039E6CDEA